MSGTDRFVSPAEVVVGRGAVTEVGERMAPRGSRALVVATPGVFERYGDRLLDSLHGAGLATTVFDEVRPDPTVENVERGLARYRAGDCDCIVTLGGGSPIDAGKAIGVVAANGGAIREYAVDRAGYEGVPSPIPPLCATNTTAGTGSEATRSVVITDESTATKFLVVATAAMPTVAVEDPDLVRTLPPSHTAFTGIDALTHAIEAFVSVHAWSMPDTLARAAIERVRRALPVAWANGDDLDARQETLVGQLQAGQAFTNSSVALVHGMARPFGAQLHVPHGLANGVLLPYVTEFSAQGAPERYAEIARLLGAADDDTPDREAARAAASAVRDLCADVSLYSYLEEFATVPDRDSYASVVDEMAADAIASGSPENNPRVPTRQEIETLYLDVYDDVLADRA
ncbi:alcohol dehydrogenase [Halobacteriales archaeon SW_5_70_135]|nr:MAG: alcohol dehydrogenase [Halobacteriales archaeon SW_5_70_135]